MDNWKAPEKDSDQGYWIKKLTSMHKRIAQQLNNLVKGEKIIPEWMTYGRTVLCQKDPAKGKTIGNYRPITCLPVMWKLIKRIIADKMYEHLVDCNLMPEKQKGITHACRGAKDQLLIIVKFSFHYRSYSF